ncbi:gasdermin-C isoform X1 [Mesocricetus auratus]|uniref:Gasdermin-C isoform X1 n=1 Tax=Mesocricetus auratus TaxID=10036 RepID=A0ABM2W734_MESAU|nr:gasdermin-C isoform X1 [Mesocricetus auratus]
MPYSFDWLCKDVVKKLQGEDLCPVKSLSNAMKFRPFAILQKDSKILPWTVQDIPVGYSLLQILEPNFPSPETEVLPTMTFTSIVFHEVEGGVGVHAIAEGSVSAGHGHSSGYDIEVQCTSIPASQLDILQNRKLVEKEPSFMKHCRIGRKDLYVVTEVYVVTRDIVLEDSSSGDLSGKVLTPQFFKAQVQGRWQRKTKNSVSIPKGAVVAYKKKKLVFDDDTCAILPFDNSKKKTFPVPQTRGLLVCEINNISPIGEYVSDGVVMEIWAILLCPPYPWLWFLREGKGHGRLDGAGGEAGEGISYVCSSFLGRLDEPLHNDFQHLQNEISEKTGLLAMLSKDVQHAVFSSLLPMLGDRDTLYDLMSMLELDQLGHMDGPGGMILYELRKDSQDILKDLILYLLQALMVLSDTQLSLLAQSVEKRLLLHQRELVKSILESNFKYSWNIPFTLQPQLLTPLQGEGLAITYGLLSECGLQMELKNPRSTWDLEAKMPMSALYGSLSFLQQLVEAKSFSEPGLSLVDAESWMHLGYGHRRGDIFVDVLGGGMKYAKTKGSFEFSIHSQLYK